METRSPSGGLPSSRLPAAAAAATEAMRDPAAAQPSSSTGAGSKYVGKGRGAGGRRRGKPEGKDWDPGRPVQGRPSPGSAPSREVDGKDGGLKLEQPALATQGDGFRHENSGWSYDQGDTGRAAAMADLYEYRGGMGGALQWLKDRVSDTIARGRGRGRRAVTE